MERKKERGRREGGRKTIGLREKARAGDLLYNI